MQFNKNSLKDTCGIADLGITEDDIVSKEELLSVIHQELKNKSIEMFTD
jgi:hypothetical protein